jgi:hypothetical protein
LFQARKCQQNGLQIRKLDHGPQVHSITVDHYFDHDEDNDPTL